ncbi:MAG: hypothetical protein DRR06_13305 [Gammaproteobacteria bacterium]|nr:MAG: hypothetical protein DRR06_13305 [Gammaproteobacteria bacterium]
MSEHSVDLLDLRNSVRDALQPVARRVFDILIDDGEEGEYWVEHDRPICKCHMADYLLVSQLKIDRALINIRMVCIYKGFTPRELATWNHAHAWSA